MTLPWEIIEAVMKINIQQYLKLAVLCKPICWGCIRELYRVVELRDLDGTNTFLTTPKNNKIPAVLIGKEGLRCLKMPQLMEILYISFDMGENNHWGQYKISFYPCLCKTLPQNVQVTRSGFWQMTMDTLQYPNSLHVVCMISSDTDLWKVCGIHLAIFNLT